MFYFFSVCFALTDVFPTDLVQLLKSYSQQPSLGLHAPFESLENTRIASSSCAFAAIRSDETVVTWGLRLRGGNSSDVQDQLHHVQRLGWRMANGFWIWNHGPNKSWGS